MQGFDYKELLTKFRYPILILLIGLIVIGGGIFFFKSGLNFGGTKVEVLSGSTESVASDSAKSITVDISGEVLTPGVYKLPDGSRINDLLVAANGFSANADRVWADKYLNRAAKLTDGQKVYVPPANQQSSPSTANVSGGDQTASATSININTASLQTLDSLPGIGQVYAQSIIEHRPYSTIGELSSKGVLKTSVYNKIKDLVSVY